ncbi:MAG: hypothetical protein WAK11_12760 [Candidatus Cybelea sp.]
MAVLVAIAWRIAENAPLASGRERARGLREAVEGLRHRGFSAQEILRAFQQAL